MMGRTQQKPSTVTPVPAQDFLVGKRLASELWIPGQKAEDVDVNSDQIKVKERQMASSLGGECKMLATHHATCTGADTHLVGVSRNGVLVALYELSDNADGVLFKRVCDHPVRELLRLGTLPATWPKKYQPINTYGGSRKLPSTVSSRDLLEAN